MMLKDKWRKWKGFEEEEEEEEEEHSSLMIWEIEEDTGRLRRKLKIEIDGNDIWI